MSELNIKVENPQDLPSDELKVNIAYSGFRFRISGDAEIREFIRFDLGWFDISEDGAVHATILDFPSDPVLTRTVKLGILEIMVAGKGRYTRLGQLAVRGGPNFSWFTAFAPHEPGVSRIGPGAAPMEGALRSPVNIGIRNGFGLWQEKNR